MAIRPRVFDPEAENRRRGLMTTDQLEQNRPALSGFELQKAAYRAAEIQKNGSVSVHYGQSGLNETRILAKPYEESAQFKTDVDARITSFNDDAATKKSSNAKTRSDNNLGITNNNNSQTIAKDKQVREKNLDAARKPKGMSEKLYVGMFKAATVENATSGEKEFSPKLFKQFSDQWRADNRGHPAKGEDKPPVAFVPGPDGKPLPPTAPRPSDTAIRTTKGWAEPVGKKDESQAKPSQGKERKRQVAPNVSDMDIDTTTASGKSEKRVAPPNRKRKGLLPPDDRPSAVFDSMSNEVLSQIIEDDMNSSDIGINAFFEKWVSKAGNRADGIIRKLRGGF